MKEDESTASDRCSSAEGRNTFGTANYCPATPAATYTNIEDAMFTDPNPFASSKLRHNDLPDHPGPPFASGHQRAVLTMGLLAIGMVIDLVGVGSTCMELNLLERIQAEQGFTELEAEQNDQRQMLIGLLQTGIYLATAILFLMWFHRVHRNLSSLGASRLKYSPGWAVGGFFVPILHLFRPYQVMKEVREGSDPTGLGGAASSGFATVGRWWTGWIIMNIVYNISFQMSMSAEQIPEFLTASQVTLFADVVSILVAILAILVVRGVDADQEARHELWSGSQLPASQAPIPGFDLTDNGRQGR